jgi:hypothetical protein
MRGIPRCQKKGALKQGETYGKHDIFLPGLMDVFFGDDTDDTTLFFLGDGYNI